ncbi:hypothetical protein WN55_07475 [Dufourea novaeangliae]|uniref:Uncharacterized protein n=1 Tax=Dufourea novaeangliae TaxID=178035 RepID=A0A154PS32_DUFNO|nr:hypothetical protein WN55_07475 [Dufourea novaeangliae]
MVRANQPRHGASPAQIFHSYCQINHDLSAGCTVVWGIDRINDATFDLAGIETNLRKRCASLKSTRHKTARETVRVRESFSPMLTHLDNGDEAIIFSAPEARYVSMRIRLTDLMWIPIVSDLLLTLLLAEIHPLFRLREDCAVCLRFNKSFTRISHGCSLSNVFLFAKNISSKTLDRTATYFTVLRETVETRTLAIRFKCVTSSFSGFLMRASSFVSSVEIYYAIMQCTMESDESQKESGRKVLKAEKSHANNPVCSHQTGHRRDGRKFATNLFPPVPRPFPVSALFSTRFYSRHVCSEKNCSRALYSVRVLHAWLHSRLSPSPFPGFPLGPPPRAFETIGGNSASRRSIRVLNKDARFDFLSIPLGRLLCVRPFKFARTSVVLGSTKRV